MITSTVEKIETKTNNIFDKQLYIIIDSSLSNMIESCIVGVMDIENVVNYLKEVLDDDFKNKYEDIILSLQTLDYNIPLFVEIPESDDSIEIIKIKKYF